MADNRWDFLKEGEQANYMRVIKKATPKAVEPDLVKVYRNAIDRAVIRLYNMETDGENRIRVPWPTTARPKIASETWADSNLRSHDITSLTATQEFIRRDTVEWHLRHLNDAAHDNRAMPNVLVVNGEHLIYDGHHRLAAFWLLGADTANCWTLEL